MSDEYTFHSATRIVKIFGPFEPGSRNVEGRSPRRCRAMVDEEIRDGDRIYELLAAELEGLEDPPFDEIRLEDPVDAVESEISGTRMARIEYEDERLCEVSVEENRLVLEFVRAHDSIRRGAEEIGVRVRTDRAETRRTIAIVERGADVKRVIDVLARSLPDR